jgi:hypothetical protein
LGDNGQEEAGHTLHFSREIHCRSSTEQSDDTLLLLLLMHSTHEATEKKRGLDVGAWLLMLTLTSISIPFPSGPSLYTFLVRSFFFFTLTLARTFDTHSQAKKGIGTILLEKAHLIVV